MFVCLFFFTDIYVSVTILFLLQENLETVYSVLCLQDPAKVVQ